MTYRLNTDRLVCFSVLLWVLLPPGVFAWEGNPPGPDNVRWLEQFCSSYMQFLTLGGVLCAVIGFVCAALVWLVLRARARRTVLPVEPSIPSEVPVGSAHEAQIAPRHRGAGPAASDPVA